MPTAQNKVHFKSGTESQWELSTRDNDTIYFLTDTKEIALGQDKYGKSPDLSDYVQKSGGTFTGPVYLPSDDPTKDTQAVTKKYVDAAVQGATGGTVTLGTPWDTTEQLVVSNSATSIKTLAKGTNNNYLSVSEDKVTWLAPEESVTNTDKLVKSSAVYSALSNKQDKLTVGTGISISESNVISSTYENLAAATAGQDLSLVTTGEKFIWNAKQDAIEFNTAYSPSTNKAATISDVNDAATYWEEI